jgi:ferritin-like metal-binding protein YciE
MAARKQLADLFVDTLKDVYHAERQILQDLPKMAKAAQSQELKNAFLKHRDETQGQIERLERVFEEIGQRAQGKPCEAIKGILDEGAEIMDDYEDSPAMDAGLVSSGQAVEHYEISRYGTLKAWADMLGLKNSVKLLDETLAETKRADQMLTKFAETTANRMAAAS